MCRFNILKKKKKEEERRKMYWKERYLRNLEDIQKNYGLLMAYKRLLYKDLRSICRNEVIDEKTGTELEGLLSTAIDSIGQIDKLLFPEKYENIDHSWDNIGWVDACEILMEAEKYTDPSNVDNMTLEEALKLIEEHNPSFVKAKREELAAQNPDPDPSQPTQ